MTTEQINRRFAELSEISWHELDDFKFGAYFCSCRHQSPTREMLASHIKKLNPDYCSDPELVLEVMKKRDDFIAFASYLDWGLLRDKEYIILAAIKWMEEKK